MQIKKSDIFNYAFIAFPVAFASIPIYKSIIIQALE